MAVSRSTLACFCARKVHVSSFGMVLFILNLATRSQASEMSAVGGGADLMLAGLFPIHRDRTATGDITEANSCGKIYPKGLILAEAMTYAVNRVNMENILPYNISFGYDVRDTCNSLSSALRATLHFVQKTKGNATNTGIMKDQANPYGNMDKIKNVTFDDTASFKSVHSASLISVIGAGNSELSLAVNSILSLYNIPQIGYASSSGILSDKSRYRTFLRVLPPDPRQAKALAKMVAHFGWNYISLVSSDDHYGGPLREVFKQEVAQRSICLAHDIVLSYRPSEHEIDRDVLLLKQSTKATVILMFSLEHIARRVLSSAQAHNLTDRIWIASDSWSNAIELFQLRLPVLKGALGTMFSFRPVPRFLDHLRDIILSASGSDAWRGQLTAALKAEGLVDKIAANKSHPMWERDFYQDPITRSALARVSYVMDCVYILAHAVKDLCQVSQTDDNLSDPNKTENVGHKEECLRKVDPRALLGRLFGRTLKAFKNTITIDKNGDPPGSYDIFNLHQKTRNSSGYNFDYINVGTYDSRTDILLLNKSKISWGLPGRGAPRSRCSDICQPGFYVERKASDLRCCWECKVCPYGQVSNASNATSCEECAPTDSPNDEKTRCIYTPLTYLHWNSPWSVVIILCALFSCIVTGATIAMFIKHRKSPVVRASSFDISIVLLSSIFLGFVLPILEIGQATDVKCKASAFAFAVVFASILSLVFAKINRTVLVFTRHLSGSCFHSRYLMSSKAHFVSALLLVVLQVAICAAWLYRRPPYATVTTVHATTLERYLHCTGITNRWFLISSGFLILLSFVCTWLAFRSRNFPENYNHAKFISYAMFTFNLIWLTFMGAYYGAPQRGYHQEVIRSFAIILSNLCVLVIMYGPKVYILFYRPDLNNQRTFRKMTLEHILRSSSSDKAGSRLSMASIRSQGNYFVMDMECDPNEKSVQTQRVLTRHAQTQTESTRWYSHKREKLFARLLRRFGNRRGLRGGAGDRAWSEGDAGPGGELPDQGGARRGGIPLSSSAPQLSTQSKPAKTRMGLNEHNLHDIAETSLEETKEMPSDDEAELIQDGNSTSHDQNHATAGNTAGASQDMGGADDVFVEVN